MKTKIKTYNHAFTFGFCVTGSLDPDSMDVTPGQMREAIISRLALITDKELEEAVELPFDTFEEYTEVETE